MQEKKEAAGRDSKIRLAGKRSTRQKTASVILCVMAALGGNMSHDISVVRGAHGYLDSSLQTSDSSEAQEEEKKGGGKREKEEEEEKKKASLLSTSMTMCQ